VQLKRSLKATSINEPGAMERFQAAASEYDAVVSRARKAARRTFDRLDEPTIAFLAKTFERGLHEGAEQALKDGKREANLRGWEWMTGEFREWRREQDFEAVEEYWGRSARGLLEGHGWLVDPQDTALMRKLGSMEMSFRYHPNLRPPSRLGLMKVLQLLQSNSSSRPSGTQRTLRSPHQHELLTMRRSVS
jgi:hypothetical protein